MPRQSAPHCFPASQHPVPENTCNSWQKRFQRRRFVDLIRQPQAAQKQRLASRMAIHRHSVTGPPKRERVFMKTTRSRSTRRRARPRIVPRQLGQRRCAMTKRAPASVKGAEDHPDLKFRRGGDDGKEPPHTTPPGGMTPRGRAVAPTQPTHAATLAARVQTNSE